MKCPNCDGPEHPKWKAHTFTRKMSPAKIVKALVPLKAKPKRMLDFVEPESTGRAPVRRKPKGFDRVAYQREYMREWRAKRKAGK